MGFITRMKPSPLSMLPPYAGGQSGAAQCEDSLAMLCGRRRLHCTPDQMKSIDFDALNVSVSDVTVINPRLLEM